MRGGFRAAFAARNDNYLPIFRPALLSASPTLRRALPTPYSTDPARRWFAPSCSSAGSRFLRPTFSFTFPVASFTLPRTSSLFGIIVVPLSPSHGDRLLHPAIAD